ncbi:MAG: hypothetical protein SGI74_14000 [Oligoflexia bacterium]|nr:hypothetical protein [Oligoflexia bacterium]
MKALVLILLSLISVNTHADLTTAFKNLEMQSKGPFDQNVLQGPLSREPIIGGITPVDSIFQAAYRNETADILAKEYDFYVGNLFTTNYYELMGEYVFGDYRSNHPLDHQSLLLENAKAFPKAASMLRHWVLEKYYVEHSPTSKIAMNFKKRGISDAQNEQTFAYYFFNFYLSSFNNNLPQFLPALLLVKDSPLGGLAALNRARDLVATTYDEYLLILGIDAPVTRRVYQIRNMVHNQLSLNVIAEIDRFYKDFPDDKPANFEEVQKILRDYYSSSASEIAKRAAKLGSAQIKKLAEVIVQKGASIGALYELSALVADMKSNIADVKFVPYEKKTDALLVIAATSQFLNKEIELKDLSKLKPTEVVAALATILNSIYIEGFLIKDNWEYFKQELSTVTAPKVAATHLSSATDIALDTLNEAFRPAFDQWVLVMPKMSSFIDNTIKSSAVNTAAIVILKIK